MGIVSLTTYNQYISANMCLKKTHVSEHLNTTRIEGLLHNKVKKQCLTAETRRVFEVPA